jgi:hypothetical protein
LPDSPRARRNNSITRARCDVIASHLPRVVQFRRMCSASIEATIMNALQIGKIRRSKPGSARKELFPRQ